MIVPGMLVCSSFLISVRMFIVSNAFLIECYSDCSRRVSHLVEPLCYGVVLSLICVVPSHMLCCMGVFGTFTVM